ncbi:SNF1-related protein kinase catalytic subunit alpha KIN10-like [Prosopis cineraria]|uniref:SNF1-related protein kinase catalytic subunit alpha KIN10-like n=1 Tax=Prosopis cineraria TaxID=364024 RepID=UPI00240F780D|nr:SNF1-related protein kinase catalytic subunit alpha KIN10-like [Prosopis cineraria]
MEESRGQQAGGSILKNKKVLENYRLGKTIGKGSFSKVKIAEHILTGHEVAIKVLKRSKIEIMNMEEKVEREIRVAKMLVHPHIVRVYEVIETESEIYIVMEYLKFGELFEYISNKGSLEEDEARQYFQQIISGIEYCHKNMVVHRDLKPENLLLSSIGYLKIIDFGLSNVMREGQFLQTCCGSPNYVAPEIIAGNQYAGPEVDVWSCGVILYGLLCGRLPFYEPNLAMLYVNIKGGIYTLPKGISSGARDLIVRMLEVDPIKRITISDIRRHPWFQAHLPTCLAAPPPDMVELASKIDDEILQVVSMGFDRNQLVDSLSRLEQNEATVVYYLLVDNQFQESGGHI